MVASAKQLRKTAVLRDRSSGDDGTMEQRLYALQDPTGSVQALANTSGQVVERFAYDSLGNAQALDANGNAYSATINFTGTDNAGLIGQYFSGSVFGNGSGSPTADGSQYAWNILYQGDALNPVAATYNTPNGVLNPGQDSMLAPNPGMQMAGLSAYSQPQGFWGFYAQHEQGIQTGAAVTAGLAATVASFGILAPEAGAGIAAVIAAQAATGAAGGFTTGYLESGFNGGSFTQNLEAGTINGGIGAALGGGLSAAGIFAPYAGQALASEIGVGGDYMTNFIRAWRMYPLSLEGSSLAQSAIMSSGPGASTFARMIWAASAARRPQIAQLAELLAGRDLSGFSFGALGQEMHGNFLDALTNATGTKPEDWFMQTDRGLTGIDATYLGNANIGFAYADLKPLTLSGVRSFLNQIDRWSLPNGPTQLWFYDRNSIIGSTGINF